jgi:type IV pilus assembly protein PilQ
MLKQRSFRATQTAALVCWAAYGLVACAVAQEGPSSQPADTGAIRTEAGAIKELHFQGADLRLVLKMLSAEGRKNIVATREVSGSVTADLYNVTFYEALGAVLRSAGFVYEEKGNLIQVMTPQQQAELARAQRVVVTRTFKLAYITSNDAKTLISPALSKDGVLATSPMSAVGIPSTKSEAGGNTYPLDDLLVVTDYEDNVKRIAQILGEIDVKPEQVLIEATLLQAKLTENNALGIDFTTLGGVSFGDINSTTTGGTQITPAGGAATPGVIRTADVNNDMSVFRTDFNAAVPAGGLSIGVIIDETAFFIRALETVSDVTVLANPKLLIVNKQRGEVIVGKREGYLTTTVTETTATQTVQFLETGTRLIVRPFIGRDGYIRLEVHPEDSDGSVELKGTAALPSESTTEITSNVLVRDGHTIVIGGLFREKTTAGRGQVPGIGSIPYVGTLFRNTVDATERQEVIILITPRIIKQDIDEQVSEQLKDDVERIRVGARAGVRWWGRQPLAQAQMRCAKQALQAGDRERALWHTELALSLDTRMDEAIRLKERLTDQAYWSRDTQWGASRFLIQRMMMNELGKPMETVTPPYKPLHTETLPEDAKKSLNIAPRIQRPLPGGPSGVELEFEEITPVAPPEPAPATQPARAPMRRPDAPTPEQAQTLALESLAADNAISRRTDQPPQ